MRCHDRVYNNITSAGHDISITVHRGMLTRGTWLWIIHLYKHDPFPDLRGCGKWISLTLKHDMSEYIYKNTTYRGQLKLAKICILNELTQNGWMTLKLSHEHINGILLIQ